MSHDCMYMYYIDPSLEKFVPRAKFPLYLVAACMKVPSGGHHIQVIC